MCNILHNYVHIAGANYRLFICILSMAFTQVAGFVDTEKYLCSAVTMFYKFSLSSSLKSCYERTYMYLKNDTYSLVYFFSEQ